MGQLTQKNGGGVILRKLLLSLVASNSPTAPNAQFASDGLDADALEKLPSLTAEEKDSLEEFFYEVRSLHDACELSQLSNAPRFFCLSVDPIVPHVSQVQGMVVLTCASSLPLQVCGADGEPPTLAELHALRILRINFHQMYGATATPNPKAIQSVYDHCMEALQSGKGIKAGDDTTASGTLSPAQSELEEWEDYHLTPEEQAEVEAVSKAPRKIQR